jgi:putative FmdB family regulatory protein
MPLYTYQCEHHGEFSAWGRMSESEAPSPCPSCAEPAPRALAHPAVGGRADAGLPPCGDLACAAPAPTGHRCEAGCLH